MRPENTRLLQMKAPKPATSPAGKVLSCEVRSYQYKKVGVELLDLTKEIQCDMFEPMRNRNRVGRLQKLVDSTDSAVRWGSMGFGQKWKLKAERRSGGATSLEELPVVKASTPIDAATVAKAR